MEISPILKIYEELQEKSGNGFPDIDNLSRDEFLRMFAKFDMSELLRLSDPRFICLDGFSGEMKNLVSLLLINMCFDIKNVVYLHTKLQLENEADLRQRLVDQESSSNESLRNAKQELEEYRHQFVVDESKMVRALRDEIDGLKYQLQVQDETRNEDFTKNSLVVIFFIFFILNLI